MSQTLETDVLIIGGGLAGLTAAVGLRDSGLRTLVVEGASSLGGRARSWIDPVTNDPVDIGPHILLDEYPNMLGLLDVLGTRDRIVWQAGSFVNIVEGRRQVEMRVSKLPAPAQFMPSLLADPAIRYRDLLSIFPVTWLTMRMSEEDVRRLDGINAYALLRGLGVTEHFIRRFWAFAAMSIMNVPVELCSAGALLRFYQRLIGHGHMSVGFADGGLGDLFAPQARDLIERSGGQVLLETPVRELSGDAGRATGAVLASGVRIEAAVCVAALPPQALRRIARPEWIARHEPFRSLVQFVPSPYVSTYLWLDRKLTRQRFWARVHDPNDLNCDFYDLSNIRTGWEDRPSVIAANCIYSHRAADLSDDEIVAATLRELADYLPEAAQAKVERQVVNRIPMAIHCPFPGTERLRPAVTTPVRDLLLAGDWIQTGLPACMESACMSGWRAAEQALARFGRQRTLAIPHRPVDGLTGLVNRANRWLRLDPLPRWLRGGRKPVDDR